VNIKYDAKYQFVTCSWWAKSSKQLFSKRISKVTTVGPVVVITSGEDGF